MKKTIALLCPALMLLLTASPLQAQISNFQDLDPLGPGNLTVSLKILGLLTVLTLAPSILLLTTAFPRIVIVLGFVRRALSTQEVPPSQVIIGLSLILTFFVMTPTINGIQTDLTGYFEGTMSDGEAYEVTMGHMRQFMWSQVDPDSVDTMLQIAKPELTAESMGTMQMKDVPLFALIPAFMLSELKRAFEMGFMLYLPFVVIDLVVASTLISMGMMVLPPVLISLPFKVLMFVLVDGWGLIVGQLAQSFQ